MCVRSNMLARIFEAVQPFITFRDLVRCRVAYGNSGVSDHLYRYCVHRQLCAVVKSSRVKYGMCAVAGCDMERMLHLQLDRRTGVRSLSWFPYCGMHKRIFCHRCGNAAGSER